MILLCFCFICYTVGQNSPICLPQCSIHFIEEYFEMILNGLRGTNGDCNEYVITMSAPDTWHFFAYLVWCTKQIISLWHVTCDNVSIVEYVTNYMPPINRQRQYDLYFYDVVPEKATCKYCSHQHIKVHMIIVLALISGILLCNVVVVLCKYVLQKKKYAILLF